MPAAFPLDKHVKPGDVERLVKLCENHVSSMNWAMTDGLELARHDLQLDVQLPPSKEDGTPGQNIHLHFEDLVLGEPVRPAAEERDTFEKRIFPRECRERRLSYTAPLRGTVVARVGGLSVELRAMKIADIPIMVQSSLCHLSKLDRQGLLKAGEEEKECGGYFICNGLEKLIRLLIMQRKNYPMAITRPAFAKRGPTFTPFGVSIRCGRPDSTSQTLYLQYTNDGACCVRIAIRKAEYFIPVVVLLKAMLDVSDRAIYDHLVATAVAEETVDKKDPSARQKADPFVADRVEIMLRAARKDLGLSHHEQCLAYLGNAFRVVLGVPDSAPDVEVGQKLLDEYILVHLTGHAAAGCEKFNLMVHMIQKLYALVGGRILEDNPDSPMNQEILLPGPLFLSILKEKLLDYLGGVRALVLRDLRRSPDKVNFEDASYLTDCLKRNPIDVTRKMNYFLATGNLQSDTGLDLMQISGYTIVGERLNYMRFLAHFRSIHRGSFFAEMKTTTVRKLLPEAWGFLCPVHTPDGSPCGLLMHLALHCKAVIYPVDTSGVVPVLVGLGMASNMPFKIPSRASVPVVLDGCVVGHIEQYRAQEFCESIRRLKVSADHPAMPDTIEVACLLPAPQGDGKTLFPSVLLFCAQARMIRPVHHIAAGAQEWVGSFEQVFMEIACQDEDKRATTTHQELAPTQMLSLAASLTPFSDFNQSPRNMYQCQMMKQTMGSPIHSWVHRADTKMYRIQTPQTPLVRNAEYVNHGIDDYSMGTNAIVAVIAYTGYDMEDAMIINKSSFERGFGHGSMYTAEMVDLDEMGESGETWFFDNPVGENGERAYPTLDQNGLPHIGLRVEKGDPLYCCVSDTTGRLDCKKHKKSEPAMVEEVRLFGNPPNFRGKQPLRRVCLKMRFNRNPVIGDKFSSRHGQKGTLSQLWPERDMPFTDSGMTPDIIINPHAFPSRMTIGMLIESMAGKAGSLHGLFHNSTPFMYNENERAIDFFGRQLQAAGYSYHGNETMYSGVSGTEMEATIFIGAVYYQRLRHMVSDKEQVRATGPVNALTHQPIKGRKAGGGIRFGEMERDSLLAHGCSYLLHDRLLRCSDYHRCYICTCCGDMLAPMAARTTVSAIDTSAEIETESADGDKPKKPRVIRRTEIHCRNPQCIEANRKVRKRQDAAEVSGTKSAKGLPQAGRIGTLAIPYVFKYLVHELAAMNIRVTFDIKEH